MPDNNHICHRFSALWRYAYPAIIPVSIRLSSSISGRLLRAIVYTAMKGRMKGKAIINNQAPPRCEEPSVSELVRRRSSSQATVEGNPSTTSHRPTVANRQIITSGAENGESPMPSTNLDSRSAAAPSTSSISLSLSGSGMTYVATSKQSIMAAGVTL
jgi:hypothetical protein